MKPSNVIEIPDAYLEACITKKEMADSLDVLGEHVVRHILEDMKNGKGLRRSLVKNGKGLSRTILQNESKIRAYLDAVDNCRNWESLLGLPERLG